MSQYPIGVYGGGELLAQLRHSVPAHTFVDGEERERCRVVIVDGDGLSDPPRKSLVRVVLYETPIDGERREGDIRIPRATFLANPGDTLAVAFDLAGTVIHAASL